MEPSRLGPYVIRSRIGRGGMGAVYEAVDPASGATVAVKTMAAHLGDDVQLRRRFLAEIEALKALRHPGIVRLLAFGEEQGAPYFAMELVRGSSLEELLRVGRRFNWREALATGVEVSRALKAAHDHGVVHRDLKPANLLFPAEPADGVAVKLADFGIARLFGDAAHTQAGTIVGTAEYMAPEQAAGGPVDQRADLYALGLVMFAMVTGRPPFQGGQALEIIDRQRHEVPPRLATLVPGVPAEFDALVARLLAKSPAERPASSLALGRLLEAVATLHPPAAGPEPGGTAVPAAITPVDLLADTMSMPGLPAAGGGPDVVAGGTTRVEIDSAAATLEPPTAAATVPLPGAAPPGERSRSRFITVEELDRATREAESRRGRRDVAVRGLVATLGLGLLAVGAAVLLRPLSADDLHARIMAIAADDAADLRDARPLIETFLARHPADPRAGTIRDLDRTLDLDALERRSRRRPRASRPVSPLERDYRAAVAREAEGASACVKALEAVLAVHGDAADPADPDHDLWLALVRRQLDRLAPLVAAERADDATRAAAALAEAAHLATEAGGDAARRTDLLARRRAILEGLVEVYAERPHAAAAVAEARRLLAAEQLPE